MDYSYNNLALRMNIFVVEVFAEKIRGGVLLKSLAAQEALMLNSWDSVPRIQYECWFYAFRKNGF